MFGLLGVTVEPHKKQLHVSLAYQFPTDKKEKLETLAKTINLKAPARWDLRLYSRDRGKANCQVMPSSVSVVKFISPLYSRNSVIRLLTICLHHCARGLSAGAREIDISSNHVICVEWISGCWMAVVMLVLKLQHL